MGLGPALGGRRKAEKPCDVDGSMGEVKRGTPSCFFFCVCVCVVFCFLFFVGGGEGGNCFGKTEMLQAPPSG